jgi:hypothetical protein
MAPPGLGEVGRAGSAAPAPGGEGDAAAAVAAAREASAAESGFAEERSDEGSDPNTEQGSAPRTEQSTEQTLATGTATAAGMADAVATEGASVAAAPDAETAPPRSLDGATRWIPAWGPGSVTEPQDVVRATPRPPSAAAPESARAAPGPRWPAPATLPLDGARNAVPLAPSEAAGAVPLGTSPVRIRVEHTLREGVVTVVVDGSEVLSLPVGLDARPWPWRRGEDQTTIDVLEGTHRVQLCVSAPAIERGALCGDTIERPFVRNRPVTIRGVHRRAIWRHEFEFAIE